MIIKLAFNSGLMQANAQMAALSHSGLDMMPDPRNQAASLPQLGKMRQPKAFRSTAMNAPFHIGVA